MAGKADVINAIADQAGISKKEAAAAFDAFVSYISDTCQRGDRCAIPGLGSFSVASRKAREGRNPRTKEKITIPASKNVRFKAGKDFRDLLNVAPKRIAAKAKR
jgi:DNA-binding protein HU-beta